MTVAELRRWERLLQDASVTSYVPALELERALEGAEGDARVLRVSPRDALVYATSRRVTLRYLNDAYVWCLVLRLLQWDWRHVVEVAPGRSVVARLALAMLPFDGVLDEVDYRNWARDASGDGSALPFAIRQIQADVLTDPQLIPPADLIMLNHAIDDLFIGWWTGERGIDYYGEAMDDVEASVRIWAEAAANEAEGQEMLAEAAREIGRRVRPGGYVVVRDYPSAYETLHRLAPRRRLTMSLTRAYVQGMRADGFVDTEGNVDEAVAGGAPGSRYPGSFHVLGRPAA